MQKTLKRLAKRASWALFEKLDCLGLHVLPKHYYTPIPDYAWLRRRRELWTRRADLTGVEWHLDAQLAWVDSVCGRFMSEVAGLSAYTEAVSRRTGPGYGPIEAQMLHCFIRHAQPARVIEVGSGVSTACIVNALSRCDPEWMHQREVHCIEPYPSAALRLLKGITIEQLLVQELDGSYFDALDRGDLLFIDSSHALKTGSDVAYIYLEVIPRLKPGVYIHIHDVYLPYIYQRDALRSYFDWQETSLVLALLKWNTHLKVLGSMSGLYYDRQAGLQRIFPDFVPQREVCGGLADPYSRGHFPSSLWLQTC